MTPTGEQGSWELQAAADLAGPARPAASTGGRTDTLAVTPPGERIADIAGYCARAYLGDAGLAEVQPQWEGMLAEDGGRYPERPEYYRAYVRHLSTAPESLVLVAVDAGEELALVAPLQRQSMRRGPLALRLLQTPMHAHLNCLAVALSGRAAPAVLDPALAVLLRADRELSPWEVLRLRNVPAQSPLLEALERVAPGRVLVRGRRARAWFDCRDEAVLLEHYPGPFRRNLTRLRRRAEQADGLRVECIRDGAELEAAFEIFLQLESAGWKGAGGTGSAIANCPRLRRYYQTLMQDFAALGRCQINLLRIGERYAAGQFCLLDDDRLAVLKIGYDEAYKALGPGVILLDEVLRHCAARPEVSRLDLTTAPDWAERWNPHHEILLDLWVFRRSLRAWFGRVVLQQGSRLKKKCQAWKGAASRGGRTGTRETRRLS